MSALTLPFMQTALAAGLLAGNALALLGVFILLRGVSFSGLAVSQLAALGAVLGAVFAVHVSGFAFAMICVGLGLWLMQRLERRGGSVRDAWVAALYTLAAALAVLVLAKAPHGEAHTMSIFFGNLLALSAHEVAEAAGLLALTLAVVLPWLRRWVWMSFDPQPAAVAGIRVERWTALFLALFALVMTLAIHIFGVLLSFAFLLLPGAAGLIFSRRLGHLLWAIPAVASTAVVGGLLLSFHLDFPAGPFIICMLSGGVLAAGLARSFVR